MHAATPDKSDRLQRVIAFLSDASPHSTMEIVIGANVMAVSAAISELRTHGYDIACWRKDDVWYYRMDNERRVA